MEKAILFSNFIKLSKRGMTHLAPRNRLKIEIIFRSCLKKTMLNIKMILSSGIDLKIGLCNNLVVNILNF